MSNIEIENNIQKLKSIENKFQKTLSEYSNKYKTYMSDVIRMTQNERNLYNNNTIITPSGDKYFVNNFGIARKWSDNAWQNKNKSCLRQINVSTDNINELGLTIGTPMRENEPCGYSGKNVRLQKSKLINLSRQQGTKAYQNTTYSNNFPASNAIDGNLNTYNHTQNRRGTYLEVTLSKSSFIKEVKIYNIKETQYRNRFKKVKLDIYDENSNVVFSKMINRTINNQEIFDVKNINKIGKVVRLTQESRESDNYINIAELQIWGYIHDTKENTGYVDKDGLLRLYPDNNIKNNTGTCPKNIVQIDEDIWNSFTKGEYMELDTICALGNIDQNIKNELVNLNNKLISLSEELYKNINQTESLIHKIGNERNEKTNILNKQLDHFKDLYKNYNTKENTNIAYEAMVEDIKIKEKMGLFRYAGWTVLVVISLFLAYRHLKK